MDRRTWRQPGAALCGALALAFSASASAGDIKFKPDGTVSSLTIKLENRYGATTGSVSHLDELGIGNRENQIVERIWSFSKLPEAKKVKPTFWDSTASYILAGESAKQALSRVKTISHKPDSETKKSFAIESANETAVIKGIRGAYAKADLPQKESILPPDDGIKRSRDKTVYGTDDRRNFYEIPAPEAIEMARAVASISLRSEKAVHARGFCTAFLIARDTALTAGHCINVNDAPTKVLRFNDHIVAAGDVPGALDVYEIDRVDAWDRPHDLAVVTLRPNAAGKLPGDSYPVVSLAKAPAAKGQTLYMIGHPGYEYKKFAPNCQVVREKYFDRNRGKHILGIDCDAFGGNSGSPVFDAGSNRVVGMLWGGQKDSLVVPKADDAIHEFAVPMELLAAGPRLNYGSWPAAVRFVRNDGPAGIRAASAAR